MDTVETVPTEGLGNRSYLVVGGRDAAVIDPPRDVDRVLGVAARRGTALAWVLETHVHNDYVSGGPELARITGARYVVPAAADVAVPHTPAADGTTLAFDGGLALRALATPGHTPHHMSYVLEEDGRPVAVFSGGSLLIGTVGRPDLVAPRLTGELAHAQHSSARRLADALDDSVRVLPTHGFGSFCSAVPAADEDTTIGRERARNPALLQDADTFVAELLAGLDDVPAYYAHMGPVNTHGPPPVDLTPPGRADAEELARRLAAGEWVVDLRSRKAFTDGHLAGAFLFELEGKLATYLAWLMPRGKPVTLLGSSPEQIAEAQRELVRVGVDRPAAAASGDPADWVRPHEALRTLSRRSFADLAAAVRRGEEPVVLDVRRDSERTRTRLRGSLHVPIHELYHRSGEVPAGRPVWVHCASGMRAAIAASMLDAEDRDVTVVDDAFDAATEAGLPVEGAAARGG